LHKTKTECPPEVNVAQLLGNTGCVVRKAFGYVLLVLSFLAWGAIAALPLLDISIGTAAAITTALVVGGEASFFLAIALLGREAWGKMKSAFRKTRNDARHGPDR
jgi:hypothetical protein